MEYMFRKAGPDDAVRINELFIEMINTIYHTDNAEGYEDGSLDRFFSGGEEWICVAERGGDAAAFLSIEVHREEEHYIYLDDLSVTKKCRGSGVGTKLIQMAEKYAKEIGITNVMLHVEKSNKNAYRLYQRLGYSIYEDQNNRLLMLKTID